MREQHLYMVTRQLDSRVFRRALTLRVCLEPQRLGRMTKNESSALAASWPLRQCCSLDLDQFRRYWSAGGLENASVRQLHGSLCSAMRFPDYLKDTQGKGDTMRPTTGHAEAYTFNEKSTSTHYLASHHISWHFGYICIHECRPICLISMVDVYGF